MDQTGPFGGLVGFILKFSFRSMACHAPDTVKPFICLKPDGFGFRKRESARLGILIRLAEPRQRATENMNIVRTAGR